jgi:hypothetical protein
MGYPTTHEKAIIRYVLILNLERLLPGQCGMSLIC